MKKLMMIAVMVLSVVFGASARDEYSHDLNTLPPAARTLLKSGFKAGLSHIKIDRELGKIKDYTVILTDGSEIEFDNKGNWKDIEVSYGKSVPASFVPTGVTEFVKKNHKGAKIVGIEKNRHGYEVELSSGVEIIFDSNGAFKKYDR